MRALLLAVAAILFTASGETQIPEPPCPVDGFDGCLIKKSVEWGVAVGDPQENDFLYRSFGEACARDDADACFAYASLLIEGSGIVERSPERFILPERTDPEEAINVFQKSCDLGAHLGCAALAQTLLKNTTGLFSQVPIADQVAIIEAHHAACKLNYEVGCDAVIELSWDVSAHLWPDGMDALFNLQVLAGERLDQLGDEFGAFSLALVYLTQAEISFDEARYELGIATLNRACAEGIKEACKLKLDLEAD